MPSNQTQLRAIATAIIEENDADTIASELLAVLPDLSDYVCTCDRCDTYCDTESTSTVADYTWCESCADEHSCSCDRCGDRVPSDDTSDIDGDCWCEHCRDNHSYYWESDGENHSEPEPEEEEDEYGIPDYHDTEVSIESERLSRVDVLGIEVETYQTEIEDAAEFFRRTRDKWNDAFKYERDGSLDSSHGVEIVAQPYSLAEIRGESSSPWSKVVAWCKSHGAKSWDAGKGYGMHISINGAALQKCHRARIVRFFNDNKDLCEMLAGRNESHWAKYSTKSKLSAESKETDKYQAAANRGPRIEVRIFRGTLNWTRFVRNCEFVDAVRVYTESSGCSDRALSADAFLAWMALPQNRTSYPLLAAELGTSKKRKSAPVAVEV